MYKYFELTNPILDVLVGPHIGWLTTSDPPCFPIVMTIFHPWMVVYYNTNEIMTFQWSNNSWKFCMAIKMWCSKNWRNLVKLIRRILQVSITTNLAITLQLSKYTEILSHDVVDSESLRERYKLALEYTPSSVDTAGTVLPEFTPKLQGIFQTSVACQVANTRSSTALLSMYSAFECVA